MPIAPRYSRPIDVHRWSDHREVNSLVDTIWSRYFQEYHTGKKAAGPAPRCRHKEQLKVLILDLYVAWATDPALSIGVSMSVNAWKVGSRYNKLHLSKTIIKFINKLHRERLIELNRGRWLGFGDGRNRSTRIQAAGDLVKSFQAAMFDQTNISRPADEETVILRAQDGKPMEYEDTQFTTEAREFLKKYNECLSKHFIDLPHLEHPFVERANAPDGQKQARVMIGRGNAHVHRVFSRGSWDLNGRFYGGWWQQIDERTRSLIYIDDKPTIEVDFRGMHVAMLSAQHDVEIEGDPYELPEGIVDLSHDEQRKYTKKLILTAINASSRKKAYAAFRNMCPNGTAGKTMTNNTLDKLLNAFVQKHPHLEGELFSDRGIHLMREDSKIAEGIIRRFLDQDKPILCVHDSFIVNHEHTEELHAAMLEVSAEHLRYPLAISQQYGNFNQILRENDRMKIQKYWADRNLPERSDGYIKRRELFRGEKEELFKEEELY